MKKINNFELTRLLDYDDAAIIEEIQRVAKEIDSHPLTSREFDKLSKVDSSTVRRRFGSWQKALEKAGVGHLYSGTVVTQSMKSRCGKRHSKQDIIAELKRVSEILGSKTFVAKDYDNIASISSSTVLRQFGSWATGLMKAGLTPGRGSRRYTDEDYFENLLNVWTFNGKQPFLRQMDEPPSIISSGAYEAKWGKWTNALRAFLLRMDQETNDVEENKFSEQKGVISPSALITVDNQNRIPKQPIKLSLRYHVLKRDRFRCVICGISPATDTTCILHVDHIFPESKGGPTILENLRTLCEKCNLGKGSNIENS